MLSAPAQPRWLCVAPTLGSPFPHHRADLIQALTKLVPRSVASSLPRGPTPDTPPTTHHCAHVPPRPQPAQIKSQLPCLHTRPLRLAVPPSARVPGDSRMLNLGEFPEDTALSACLPVPPASPSTQGTSHLEPLAPMRPSHPSWGAWEAWAFSPTPAGR